MSEFNWDTATPYLRRKQVLNVRKENATLIQGILGSEYRVWINDGKKNFAVIECSNEFRIGLDLTPHETWKPLNALEFIRLAKENSKRKFYRTTESAHFSKVIEILLAHEAILNEKEALANSIPAVSNKPSIKFKM